MYFQHSSDIWRDFPDLAAGALLADGITGDVPAGPRIAGHHATARSRLAGGPESELPEIRAWRRTFAAMGLKPTQYRCASESLLRRFKKDGTLPRIHPLIDVCNAISLAFAIPVAVFDLSKVTGFLEVRHASGEEEHLTFAGEIEHPEAHEVVFADGAGRTHARRWSNRQSGLSAVRDTTSSVLIVAEALHATAADDVRALMATLADDLKALWATSPETALLSPGSPRLEW
jgi:DNA/RNA-binding domain of Phe-tRNA-synthetase-like protein